MSSISIPTKGLQAGHFNAIITVDNKGANKNSVDYQPPVVKFYLNGKLVGENTFDKLLNIQKEPYLYLGVGDPDRKEKNNWFKGKIDTFATYNDVLTDSECLQLGSNLKDSLFNLKSNDKLVSYYDSKFVNGTDLIDLRGGNNARVFNCEQTFTQYTSDITKPIPHRKEGKFKILPHRENGYKDGYWVSWTSRENQLRYLNNYYSLKSNYQKDGLTNCKYKVRNEFNSENYYHIEVML